MRVGQHRGDKTINHAAGQPGTYLVTARFDGKLCMGWEGKTVRQYIIQYISASSTLHMCRGVTSFMTTVSVS